MSSPDRILIVRLGALGDVVRTLPAAFAIRRTHPKAYLAWLVEPHSAGALAERGWLDRRIVFPRDQITQLWREGKRLAAARRVAELVRSLRAESFDCVADFHSILKSGLLSRASGAPIRLAFRSPHGREGAGWWATDHPALTPDKRSRYERNAALASMLGAQPIDLRDALVPSARARERASSWMAGQPAPVLLHPGSSPKAAHKRWPPDGYATLARMLWRTQGVPSWVLWVPGEEALAERIVAASDGAARLAPETPEFEDLAALIERGRLLIGSDSGPLHVASLVGTPVVQILGPTDAIENQPAPGSIARQVRIPVACSPCRRGCARPSCTNALPPEQVARAAVELLEAVSRPRVAACT